MVQRCRAQLFIFICVRHYLDFEDITGNSSNEMNKKCQDDGGKNCECTVESDYNDCQGTGDRVRTI